MRTFIKRALLGTLLAGGITLLGATVANAAETTGDDGLLSGTQAIIDVQAPVTIVGNAISVIGDTLTAPAAAAPASAAPPSPATDATTSGSDGVGSGTQALVNVVVPITVTGNSVSVVGDSATAGAAPAAPSATAPAAPAASTSGEDSILSGTQVIAPITAPITVAGNAISVIGDSQSTGATAPAGTTGGTAPAGCDLRRGQHPRRHPGHRPDHGARERHR